MLLLLIFSTSEFLLSLILRIFSKVRVLLVASLSFVSHHLICILILQRNLILRHPLTHDVQDGTFFHPTVPFSQLKYTRSEMYADRYSITRKKAKEYSYCFQIEMDLDLWKFYEKGAMSFCEKMSNFREDLAYMRIFNLVTHQKDFAE